MQKKLPKIYLFVENFKPKVLDGLNKNISIIYRNYIKKVNESTIISLKNYCRLNKREFFLAINIKLAIKYRLNGVYIPSFIKTKNFNFYPKPKNFLIIGSAHNKSEIIIKKDQGCSSIFLAPIFKVAKKQNFLDIHRFNFLTLGIEKEFIALGGINEKNVKKLNLVNIKGFSGISWIKKTGLKKLGRF